MNSNFRRLILVMGLIAYSSLLVTQANAARRPLTTVIIVTTNDKPVVSAP